MKMPPTFAAFGRRLVDTLAPFTRRWRMLDRRMQNVVGSGALILIVACLYATVWLPAARERERLTVRLPHLTAQLALMQAHAEEIRRLSSASPITPAPPVAADTTALQSLFGEGTQASVDAGRGFRIVIPKISYAKWWDRQGDVQARHQLQIVSLSLQALPGGSREVSIDMRLAEKNSNASGTAK